MFRRAVSCELFVSFAHFSVVSFPSKPSSNRLTIFFRRSLTTIDSWLSRRQNASFSKTGLPRSRQTQEPLARCQTPIVRLGGRRQRANQIRIRLLASMRHRELLCRNARKDPIAR